jgi:hypothetical protein
MPERVHVAPAERTVIDVAVVTSPVIVAVIIVVIIHTAIIPSVPQPR